MAENMPDDWRELAEAVRHEYNTDRLIQLVTELNRVLEEQAARLRANRISENEIPPPGYTESSAIPSPGSECRPLHRTARRYAPVHKSHCRSSWGPGRMLGTERMA